MTGHKHLVKVSKLAGQWALLLSAVKSSFVPREKSLALEVIPNHESNDPFFKSGFCHLLLSPYCVGRRHDNLSVQINLAKFAK